MTESMPVLAELTPELDAFIVEWKDKPGNLVMVLHKVQEIYRYIPRDVAAAVSKKLGVPLAKIYGVMTFYHYFKLEKPGKHIISVCMGTACYLKGGDKLLDELKKLLNVEANATTEDGQFTLQAVRCVGCCGLAPLITVGTNVYGTLPESRLPEILEKYSK
ncbi:MAG: NAD(P)H-dependent oxidoreductase subunit E [Chitinispirillales bacterium]|jgi:NADH-quinone oxidoreductase subunit E|nr:NAD(P)H-dependent oxidoreductase subunit E [Chitinispirillales bacterium]